MTLAPMIGHAAVRRRLASAWASGRLPQVLLFLGGQGIGKQRLGLWLGQLILCERPAREPCGQCRPCQLVLGLAHPDLHWFTPVPRPKTGDADKQVEEVAELLAEVMAERREQPLYAPPDGMAAHGVASARLLLRRASLTPVEGRKKVFLIGDAERLVPQESSPEAANALLKLLEEPPVDAVFILTAEDAQSLLPTIRSRAIPLRLGRLADAEVGGFLQDWMRPAPSPADAEARARSARGSIGRAISAAGDDLKARKAAQGVLEAAVAGAGQRMERALQQPPWQARGDFSAMLDGLADLLSNAARADLGGTPAPGAPGRLRSRAGAEGIARALERVAVAREAARGNVNPQLLLAVLQAELAQIL